MSGSTDRDTLSIGVFLVILVVGIVLGLVNAISWNLVPPVIIALSGVWVLALAWMQTTNPQKYAFSAFTLASWGILLAAIGGAWYFAYVNVIYSLVVILVAFAAVAITASLRRH